MRGMAAAAFGAILLALPAAAMARGPGNQALQPGTAGPHPNRQATAEAGHGLFPPNQPVPEYATGANNANASMTAPPRSYVPNAGDTALNPTSKPYGQLDRHP